MEALESSEQSCGERVWNPHDGGLLFMVPYNKMDRSQPLMVRNQKESLRYDPSANHFGRYPLSRSSLF